jgi:AcrR family transcriptional regulator
MSANDRYHHGDLPSALLEAVGRLIERDGLGAVSLRAAARDVGVSHAAPAHHFRDKRGMLTAFAARGYEAFSAQMARTWRDSAGAPPAERLRRLTRAYVAFASGHRAYYEVMFRPEMVDRLALAARPATDDAFGVLCAAVAANLPAGTDREQVRELALVAWCNVHGMVQLWFEGPLQHMHKGRSLEALQERSCDVFLSAVAAGVPPRGDAGSSQAR